MRIKAVLWDIDGTLIDSEPLHLEALLAVCRQFDVDVSDLPDDAFVGVSLKGVWEALRCRFPADLSAERWEGFINDHYESKSAFMLRPTQGALKAVQNCQALGVRQAAVSNSGRRVVDTNLSHLGIEDVLEFSISLDDVSEGKPSPAPYLQALARMELEPHQALAVEDSLSGARSAKAAGITVAAYNTTDPSFDLLIEDLRQLTWHISML